MGYFCVVGCPQHIIVYFQFPLWDTLFRRANVIYTQNKSFNSLYGIQTIMSIMKKKWKGYFQFPLWDTYFVFISEQMVTSYFQFPLWDTTFLQIGQVYLKNIFQFPLWDTELHARFSPTFWTNPFNSLYGIRMVAIARYSNGKFSIPFMGYFQFLIVAYSYEVYFSIPFMGY